ncbi:hypothetical protein BH10BAC5_BH10BAC5_12530 [soil metagenome]
MKKYLMFALLLLLISLVYFANSYASDIPNP